MLTKSAQHSCCLRGLCLMKCIVFSGTIQAVGNSLLIEQASNYFSQQWVVDPNPSHYQHVYIWKNTESQCWSYGDSTDSNGDYNSPGCSCVLELMVGDQVFVSSEKREPVGCAPCTYVWPGNQSVVHHVLHSQAFSLRLMSDWFPACWHNEHMSNWLLTSIRLTDS